ncbi:uncharacterized protein LOC141642465 isoform X2 [Silene latifolia]|uniref:uncharacterized protein LOC141642465 isoform X2 n=2 Tax=Silene latifolia TaxID=37657 RepID=UPI003D7766E5
MIARNIYTCSLIQFKFKYGRILYNQLGAAQGMSYTLTTPSLPLNLNSPLTSPKTDLEGGQPQFLEPPNPSFKWRLLIAYDGTRYSGWQYQASPPTVQCAIEDALIKTTKLDRKDLCVVGAGRTDKGVHAWGQVAHFLTPFNYDTLDDVHAALNGLLPADIRVREISPALPEFHARFSARGKMYRYTIYNDSVICPFHRHYAYHSGYDLNAVVMAEGAAHFIGKHDFSAFANAQHNDRIRDPVKTISHFDVYEKGPVIELEVQGSGFLYRQVRNMVALLLQIGKKAVPSDIVPKILETKNRRELAKYTLAAPPHGLSLVEVKYKEEHMGLPVGGPAVSLGRRHTITRCKLPYY